MDKGSSGDRNRPFHSGGLLKDSWCQPLGLESTKEWAQLLIVTVRVASLPGLLATTTISGA